VTKERSRLRRARESGYLNAACRDPDPLIAAFARWCWRLRLPMVWCERISPGSRYGRVRLDLFTTPHSLTAAGQAAMRSLAPPSTASPHDARWERVPLRDIDQLAASVLRAALRPDNYQVHRPEPLALSAPIDLRRAG
jgi:hypothetical protein